MFCRIWITITIVALALGCGDCGDGADGTEPEQISEWTPEICDSGEDEDGDGQIDCADSDCYTAEVCIFEPVVNAPELPLNGVISLWERSSWLFDSGLVQRGVVDGAIEPETIGTVRGQILGTDGSPLVGAAVSVVGRPEFGRTYSRGDGLFDLAFAADARLVLRVSAAGFVSSDRVLKTRHQMPTSLERIVLVPLEAEATEVDFSKAQLVMGSESTDEDGTRRTAAIFPKGVKASLVFPNGARRELESMHVRLTEVTVGDDGRQAMMAELPPTTLYTYAAEFTVDEAVAENAERVEFSEPVFIYVDNFLGFEAGAIVPSGFYDRRQTVWEPMPNGVVLDVVEISAGRAVLSMGDGPLDAEEHSLLAITEEELRELAKMVKAGDSVWRVPTTHFSPFDFNWGGFYPPGTAPPPGPLDDFEQSCSMGQEAGSIIGCSNQTLGERIPLNGTPFELTYQSSRVSGRKPVIVVPVRPSLSDNVVAARVKVTAAGQRLDEREFLNASEVPIVEEFIWDGKDGFGRPIQGAAEVEVEVDLVFTAPYNLCGGGIVRVPQAAVGVVCRPPTGIAEFPNPEFGTYPAEPGVLVSLGRSLVVISRKYTQFANTYDVAREGLGGWTIGPQHRYDPIGRVMYYGNGQDLVAGPEDRVLEPISGDGEVLYGVWDMPEGENAANVNLVGESMAVGLDGTVYVQSSTKVHAISPSTREVRTIITTQEQFLGDSKPPGIKLPPESSTQVDCCPIGRIRMGRDGELYIINGRTVWQLNDGELDLIVGDNLGPNEDPADGEDGLKAKVSWSYLDVSRDGIIYLADNKRIYQRTTDGLLRHVVVPEVDNCTIDNAPCGDDGLAAKAQFTEIRSIALSEAGDLYVLEDATEPNFLTGEGSRSRIRKIRPDGMIETVAEIPFSTQIEIGDGDIVYFSPSLYLGGAVFQLRDDGDFVARAGVYDPESDVNEHFNRVIKNQRANRPLAAGFGFALGLNSQIIFSQMSQIVRLNELFPGYTGANYQIPTPDGAVIDEFNAEGRHLASYDALTGTELGHFEYDDEGRLLKVHQRGGNITEIVRQAGNPQQIRGPDGVTWSLETRDRMLAGLVGPEGERWEFEYDDGLMTRMVNPRGEEWRFAYDEAGRLIEDRQPDGGVARLERDKDRNAVTFTSPEGRQTLYGGTPPLSGDRSERVETGDFQSTRQQLRNGWMQSRSQDGSELLVLPQSHPIYGMIARYPAHVWFSTPSGLYTESTSELVATNASNSLKDGLESFTHTLTHPRGRATTEWDKEALTLTSESAGRRTSRRILDTEGRPLRLEVGSFEPVNFEYDARSRPVRVTQGTREQSLTYDEDGYVASVTGADGTVRLSRDAMGRVLKATRQDLTEIDFGYDLLGNLTGVTPPGRPSYTMSSDFRGNLLTMTTPGGTQESYVLDLDHRLTSATMGDGRGWSVSYDASDRVEQMQVAGESYAFDYGEDAYMSWARGGEADVEFEWDGPLPVRQSTTGAVNGAVSWAFEDGTLSLATMSINGHEVDYAWDKDGLPRQIGQQSLSYRTRSYFLSEREVGSARVTYAYSDFGELNDLRVRAGGELFRVRYTRDDLGRITEARETNQGTTTTYAYSYDLLGQVAEVRVNGTLHATYAYDANSNRIGIVSADQTVTAANITHNADDQLLQYGDISYTYNAAGQLAQKTQGAELTRYSYGVLGELQRVELPDGRAITYQYDALKRRIGRQVNGASTHRWLWGGGPGPVAELDANGNTLTTFVYGTGIGSPDYMVRGAETFALIRDHLGSVRFVLNTADNSIAQELRYDPFGKVILDTNPGFQPFGYAGGLYDPDTELTRFGARDYDAHTARWTARDPIAFGGGQTNLYVYVGNDPINFVDPNGAIAIPVVLGGIWAAIEFGLLVYDIYDTATTLMDPCASDIDKALSVTGLLSGAILPGGGYGTAAKAVRKCSFTAETPVLMCDGSHKAIKEVRQGDLVLAQHKETGEVACREVQSRSANPNQAIILVTLESADGTTEVIETTENHPFYVEGRGWTRVDELVPGDLVPSARNGILVVSALEWTDRAEIVYNFGVNEFHTYFVGESGAWVHNCLFDELRDKLGNMGKDEFERLASRWDKATFDSLKESLEYHAREHGDPNDIAKYLRQADGFTKKRALKNPLEDGAIRYEKNGKYMIERNGKIVSYGPQ